MYFYRIVLLVVVPFVAISAAGSTKVYATLTTSHFLTHSVTGNNDDISIVRMLRTNWKPDVEERAGNAPAGNVPIGSKIVNWFFSSKSTEGKLTVAENYKIRNWVKNKKSSEYVFNRLELGGGLDKVLTNPKLKLYVSYIDHFNKQNPRKKVTMVDMFTNTYSDDAVSKMIEVGLTTPQTRSFATRMYHELLGSWQSQGKTADDVFTLLKIDTAGYNLFRTPKMSKDSNPTPNLFAAYIHQLNKQNPRNKVKMIDFFAKKYNDDVIAKMVEMGVTVPTTKRVASLLRKQLIAKWNNNAESADDVFKLLKLDKAGDELFASPELKTLYSYTTKTYTQDSKKVLLQVLTDHYGYDGLSKIFVMGQRRMDLSFLAKDLETTMGVQWLKDKLSPAEVFKLLKLNDDVDTLLTNPNFLRTWESYRFMFDSKNDVKTTTIETLRKFYSDKELLGMLEVAKDVPATKSLAMKLLDEMKK